MDRSELREIIVRITEIIGEEGVPEAACFLFGDSGVRIGSYGELTGDQNIYGSLGDDGLS